MSKDDLVLDDIVEELDEHQLGLLAEFWTKLDVLTKLQDFNQDTLKLSADKKIYPEQEATFDMAILKSKAVQTALKDLTPTTLHQALLRNVKHEDPDTLLVRFLRARSWDMDKAMTMLLQSLRWRIEERIEDDLIVGGDSQCAEDAANASGQTQQIAKEILHQCSCGESFVHKTDNTGRPVQYIRVKLHDPNAQSKYGFERATILDAETTRMLLRPPHSAVSIVFDLTGFSLSNMDMNALKVMHSGLANNYPESLGHVYVFNAPWIVNGIWAVVKSWLDPVVASKVHFLSSLAQLAEFIPKANIPKYMGGESDFAFEWIPPNSVQSDRLPADDKKAEIMKERTQLLEQYQEATRRWALEIQTSPAEQAMATRRKIAQKLASNYWLLDPYVRGRCINNRAGILKTDGSVVW